MSAVETPIVTPIVAAPAPVTPVEAPAAPAAESAVEVAPIAGSTEDAPTATTAAVEKDAAAAPALKRSPFSDLKNKLFAPKVRSLSLSPLPACLCAVGSLARRTMIWYDRGTAGTGIERESRRNP